VNRVVTGDLRGRWRPPRTWLAAVVVVAIMASLLLGWYWAGSAEVAARSEQVRTRPIAELQTRVASVADELRRDLDDVLRRESLRPYYHYGNLFRDPRGASTGLSLSPSPLAGGPTEPLISDHFQIDAAGAVTLPTINDDAPELSDLPRLAAHQQARRELAAAASVVRDRVLGAGIALASAEQAQQQAPTELPSSVRPAQDKRAAVGATRTTKPVQNLVERLDPDIYAQNTAPTQVYENIVSQKRVGPISQRSQIERAPRPAARHRDLAGGPPVPKPSPNALRNLEDGRISIVTSPLAWQTATLAAQPKLLAVREVSTPDGRLVQGWLVDRVALERWLLDREVGGGVTVVTVSPDRLDASGSESGTRKGVVTSWVAGPWSLRATPTAASLATAAEGAAAMEYAFLWRFIAVALAAVLAGGFVVLLMANAERLAHERSQFAAAAAHELRTPLAGLQLYGDMLADGLGDPDKARDYAHRLREEAARLGRVVSNVLGFSQLERGNLTLALRDDDLAATLRDLVVRAEPAFDRLGVTIDLAIPASLPAHFDRDAVIRIVGNLLDNAEKYSRNAEDRTIAIAAVSTVASVQIIVRDHGPGIEPHAARRMFRPFARGASADGPAGLGLGLALSRSLAEAMGGSLQYRRIEDQTEFSLRLPRQA
jgi:signal transduction histidine kinase